MVKFWFTVKVTETDPDGVALRNLDSLDKVKVVGVIFGVVGRGEDTNYWLLPFQPRRRNLTIIENFQQLQSQLTPFKTPTAPSDTLIRMEKEMDSLGDAG